MIIGGGAIGSAVAYWLTADPAFVGEVVVVERDPTYRAASSALSASSIRQQFSTPVNIAIGLFGIGFLRGIGETLAVNGERPDIGLVEPGYLFLATEPGMATLRANHAVQVAHGADVELLTPDELRRRYPWLTVEDLAGGSHGRTGEGWFDGYGLLRAFRAKAIAQGARYLAAEAVGLDRGRRQDRGRSASLTARRSPATSSSTPPDPGPRVSPPWPMSTCRSGRGRARCSCWRARPPCPAARWSSTPRASGSAPRAATSSPAPRPARARITTTCRWSPTTRCSRR